VVDRIVVDDFVAGWQNEYFLVFVHAFPLGDEHLNIGQGFVGWKFTSFVAKHSAGQLIGGTLRPF
jgi:hypothetical protein